MTKKSINTILAVIIIVGAAFLFGKRGYLVKHVEVKAISAPILPKAKPDERQIYGINKIKTRQQDEYKGDVKDLASLYENYPKEHAGENMMEAWARVSPEDKAEFMKGLGEEIEKSKEALKGSPDDSKARSKLIISENLKKLALNNFNYKFRDNKNGGK
ncbi:MAG: hypothetical protein V1927_01865 [Candidatus Omnitrophota bacterium]